MPSNPIHENDIERLLSVESEEMEGTSWSRVKKTKDAEVWRREANEEGFPPITKVLFNICYQFFTLLSLLFLALAIVC